jgi:hypothetical protein
VHFYCRYTKATKYIWFTNLLRKALVYLRNLIGGHRRLSWSLRCTRGTWVDSAQNYYSNEHHVSRCERNNATVHQRKRCITQHYWCPSRHAQVYRVFDNIETCYVASSKIVSYLSSSLRQMSVFTVSTKHTYTASIERCDSWGFWYKSNYIWRLSFIGIVGGLTQRSIIYCSSKFVLPFARCDKYMQKIGSPPLVFPSIAILLLCCPIIDRCIAQCEYGVLGRGFYRRDRFQWLVLWYYRSIYSI